MPEIVTFGNKTDILEGKMPVFCSTNYRLTDGYPEFDVLMNGRFCLHARLVIPGEYNAMNALAAIACSVINGADPNACSNVLSRFYGADNRFNLRGSYLGAQVYSDYAHHPSAIKASYNAACDLTKGSVWTVFQPITYNRAIGLFREFVQALSQCSFSLLFEVYTSREADNKGFSSRMICDEINADSARDTGNAVNTVKSVFVDNFAHMRSVLRERVKPGDIVLFMGPERMEDYADMLCDTGEDTFD
jgi:UDP-N-acetylmuramate--alanine ligase